MAQLPPARHRVETGGEFGELVAETRSVPAPDHPKTRHLAALSVIATLRRITDPVQLGT